VTTPVRRRRPGRPLLLLRRLPLLRIVALLFAVGGATDADARAAAPDATRTKTPAAPRLEPGRALTGKLLVATLVVPPALGRVVGVTTTLGTRSGVGFAAADDGRRWTLLLPVEIDEPARRLPLVVDAHLDDGDVITLRRDVRVQPGRYEKRAITVGRQFTQPSPQEQQRAAAEARELEAALATTAPERLWRGRFATPTPGPVTSPFGTLRTYNKTRRARHLGLDLDGDVGAPVVAANAGRVVVAKERFYSGGTVVLDHGQGFFTMYFHLSRIDVVVGQDVDRASPLGAVGATGQVTGPHLHFVARLGGCSVDPAQLLALALDDRAPAAPRGRGPAPVDAATAPDSAPPTTTTTAGTPVAPSESEREPRRPRGPRTHPRARCTERIGLRGHPRRSPGMRGRQRAR
jgi:murein DD-endopeptidase MepM/ murein hydrolase activator NlpD